MELPKLPTTIRMNIQKLPTTEEKLDYYTEKQNYLKLWSKETNKRLKGTKYKIYNKYWHNLIIIALVGLILAILVSLVIAYAFIEPYMPIIKKLWIDYVVNYSG